MAASTKWRNRYRATSETSSRREKAGGLAVYRKQNRFSGRRVLVPPDDVRRHLQPLVVLQVEPFIVTRRLIDFELGFYFIRAVAAASEGKPISRRFGQPARLVPVLDFWRGFGVLRLPLRRSTFRHENIGKRAGSGNDGKPENSVWYAARRHSGLLRKDSRP